MAKKKTVQEKRESGMKCSPSDETREKLAKKAKANFKKGPLPQINGLAKEMQFEAGYKTKVIPEKRVEVPNMPWGTAVSKATKELKRTGKIKKK